jgi:hypothetical protein
MDIKKTDSKGRLSLGLPNQYVGVTVLGNGRYYVELIFNESDMIPIPTPPEALEYMGSHGLDVNRIARDGATSEGYDEFNFDRDGNRVRAFGASLTTRKPWPAGFDWQHFLNLALGKK